jgi:hypothetical protein
MPHREGDSRYEPPDIWRHRGAGVPESPSISTAWVSANARPVFNSHFAESRLSDGDSAGIMPVIVEFSVLAGSSEIYRDRTEVTFCSPGTHGFREEESIHSSVSDPT